MTLTTAQPADPSAAAVDSAHAEPAANAYLRPAPVGTLALVLGIAISWFTLDGDTPSALVSSPSRILLVAIGISVLFDMRSSLRNLVRVDLFAILALYFLIFFEFLFEQRDFDQMATVEGTRFAVELVLLAFLGLVVGRHLVRPERATLVFLRTLDLSPKLYVWIMVGSFFLSTFYMFLAVNFNVFDWFYHMNGPRFTQPWGRGQLGGWRELLNELALFGLIIPPIVGVIFARHKEYSKGVLFLALLFLIFQLYISIAPGTRNVLAVNMAGLMGGYFLSQPKIRIRPLIIWGLALGAFFVVVSDHMLAFRAMGLRAYVEGGHYQKEAREFALMEDSAGGFMEGKGYFVDYNLLTIHDLTGVFPSQFGFLGWDLYWVAFTKPVPRAIWRGKPEGLAVGIEESLGVAGMTLAATFVGEAYIAGGMLAVFLTALGLGAIFAFWNRLGCSSNSTYALLVYAAGFFAALITMRSLMFSTTLFLPAVALIVFAKYFLHKPGAASPSP